MIQITQMKLPVEHTEADIEKKIIKELELKRIFKDMPSFTVNICRRSIDARKKPEIYYIYSVSMIFYNSAKYSEKDITDSNIKYSEILDESLRIEKTILNKCRSKNVSVYNPTVYIPRNKTEISEEVLKRNRIKAPVIIGEGPCGLFAGLILAKAGLKPIIFERGDNVDNRVEKVEKFWLTESIDTETNVQFGEGGAGTFSDGKLNTLVKDKTGKNQFVLDTFVRFGANPQIAYDSKPHIGTDVLREVVRNMRNEIIRLGGQIHHLCRLTDVVSEENQVKSVIVDNTSDKDFEIIDPFDARTIVLKGKSRDNEIPVESLVLALGHSSRDTFRRLVNCGLNIEQKNFAIGIRIQHPQSLINDSQYGKGHNKKLPPSPYKVTNHTSNNRDVFSFCMCPGGYVVNASSVPGFTCVNGMSFSDRGSLNANSALIVSVDRCDFGSDDVLAGMYLQEKMEKIANNIGNGKIPVQLYKDFKEGKISKGFGKVTPMFKGNTEFANLREIFPEDINEAIIESIDKFGYTIEGFDDGDAILAAVEARTSSPIRITRDEKLESNIKGVFPAGEGAGYAGGIMSAAMDGIKVADAIIDKLLLENNLL